EFHHLAPLSFDRGNQAAEVSVEQASHFLRPLGATLRQCLSERCKARDIGKQHGGRELLHKRRQGRIGEQRTGQAGRDIGQHGSERLREKPVPYCSTKGLTSRMKRTIESRSCLRL